MATVYLARDLKHDRSVALKVLKPELAAVVGAERFLAEIKTTANLQHPHNLPLFRSAAEPFIVTEFMERSAIFSPDGSWVAYVSNKSGQDEVYARPFPGPGPEVTISVGGGDEPAWARSGAEIFYRREGELMVVPVERTGSVLNVGTPRRLFEDTYRRDTAGAAGGANYDVSPEGDRFVMVEDRSALDPSVAASTRLRVVLNFFEELRARVPN